MIQQVHATRCTRATLIQLSVPMSYAALALGLIQIVFVANVLGSLRLGRRAAANPWGATTLEWSPADAPPRAYREPYGYSVPGAALDYIPQREQMKVQGWSLMDSVFVSICPVCYAPTDAVVRESLNLGIFGVMRFMVSTARRSRDAPPHDIESSIGR